MPHSRASSCSHTELDWYAGIGDAWHAAVAAVPPGRIVACTSKAVARWAREHQVGIESP